MREWDAPRVAAAARARLERPAVVSAGPVRVVIDSRVVRPGDLFVGLPGERADGGSFAAGALAAGAWGVLTQPAWAAELARGREEGAVLSAEDPVAALGRLACEWRRALGVPVIAVTGSVGKTSTKDLIAALAAPQRTVAASRENFNTEIGLPLELLAAPRGTELVVLELAMRGFGQIAELTAICEPDVGVITNVGPVHLEQVGSLEGVARAKGELLEGMRDGAIAVVPAGERRLDPLLRPALRVLSFGVDGNVRYARTDRGGGSRGGPAEILAPDGERLRLELPFSAVHQRVNALAAVAACLAVGIHPAGRVEVAFSRLRGERVLLGLGAVVVNDCYNANPLSMAAALEDLARERPEGRRIAVLGDMLELGPDEERHHAAVGAAAAAAGVDVLVAVGPRSVAMLSAYDGEAHAVADARAAAALAREVVAPGDVVLVKGSRGVGLEVVAEALAVAEAPAGASARGR